MRYAGRGPVVVLVHKAPTSGRTLDLQTRAFASAGFLALALDIPWLGHSDPLPIPRPEIEDLSESLHDTLNVLGLGRVALYGAHTGALVCADFAASHPDRVSAVLIDGYPVFSATERARLVASYFPPNDISWDGSHLLWLWCRYREQHLFWPWNVPGDVTQARCDVPDPEYLHEGVIDLLRAGNGYRLPYSAAFRCASEALVNKLRVPTFFLAYPDDSLSAGLTLLANLPEACRIEPMPLDRKVGVAREVELLRAHPGDSAEPRLSTVDRRTGITRSYIEIGDGQLALRTAGPDVGRPLVVVPPIPGSGSMLVAEIEALARDRQVIAIDAPGCGDSDRFADVVDVEAIARTLALAIDKIGIDEFDLYALNGGCSAAVEIAKIRARSVRNVVLEAPARTHADIPDYVARYAPPIEPRWDGGHLVTLWHTVRNRRLFRPWFDQRVAARISGAAAVRLEPESINQEVLSYLESWRTHSSAWRAVLKYPTVERARLAGRGIALAARGSDEFFDPSFECLSEAMLPRIDRLRALLGAAERCG
ncbi:MAG: alpha/beta fold hydrolase [Nitrospiraceae bacterium]